MEENGEYNVFLVLEDEDEEEKSFLQVFFLSFVPFLSRVLYPAGWLACFATYLPATPMLSTYLVVY